MTKTDPAAALSELAKGVIAKVLTDLKVAIPCKVLSFNETTGMAVIQPTIMLSDNPPAPIQNVPALGQKLRANGGEELILYPAIKQGDIVYAVCADRHILKAQSGQIAKPDSKRMHDINDAVIVGVFPCSLQS